LRILFLSQLFDPENAIKGASFIRALQALGHEIEVVTTFPSYPGGKIYDGYHQSWREFEDLAGVRVVRVPSFISHESSAMKRVLSYTSFVLSAAWYSLVSAKKADVIYAYYPPVLVGLTAMILGWVKRIPYVYDVQDLWPEALVATGHLSKNSKGIFWIDWVCGLIYKKAARIVVLSQGYRTLLISKGVSPEKVVCIYNWCDETRLQFEGPMPVIWRDIPGKFRVLYAGNFGSAQSLSHVIGAAEILHQSGDRQIQIVFLGSGVNLDALRAQAIGLPNLTFIPPVKVDEVGQYLSAADVLLIHLAKNQVFDNTIPQKTQAYLMAGKPILMAVGGEAADLVLRAQAGIVVTPENSLAMAEALRMLARMPRAQLEIMGKNGYDFYKKTMSMSHGVQAIERLLQEVTKS